MTLRHFTIFSEVCKKGSITKAADALNLAQPAVSNAIREMESFYGTRLFERMNRRLYINEAGEQLLQYADSILSQYDEAKNVLRDISTMTRIRIGANVSFGTGSLPGLIRDFSKKYSDIPVYTRVENSHHIEELLLSNELDMGIIDYPEKPENFFFHMLCEDTLLAVCSKDFPIKNDISREQLGKVPFLLREEGSGSRALVDSLKKQTGGLSVVMESTSGQSLISACLCGMGVLILPESLLKEHIMRGAFKEIHIQDADFERKYYLVYHKSKFLTKSMKCFKDFTEKRFSPDSL